MKKHFMLISVLGIGCGTVIGMSEKESLSTETEDGTTCSATILNTTPYPDAIDMYYRNAIEVTLSDMDTEASIQLFDEDGEEVNGESVWVDNTLQFAPDSPLHPSHSYVANINYCGSVDPVALSFRTSNLGLPLEEGNEVLTGKTFPLICLPVLFCIQPTSAIC